MTIDEAKKMLEAKLECLKHETSGTDYACNQHLCEDCSLNYEQGNVGEQKEALEMATKALEQQTAEDCISREQAVNEINKKVLCHTYEAREIIEKLPSVQPQPKRGKWMRPYKFSAIYECSLCYKQIPITDGFYEFYYCPNCGADMREVQDANNS